MTTPDQTADNAGRVLTLELTLRAPRDAVWRCWTESGLLQRWFCPAPWQVARAEMDPCPGGRFDVTMRSPEGDEHPNQGVFLAVEPHERLVFTDAFTTGWHPSGKPFMTGVITLADAPGGGTAYRAQARHWSAEDREAHEAMGFEPGWTAAARQLEALAASL